MSAAPPGAPERKAPPLSAVLQSLADDATRERISVSDLLAALGDRALAALLFVFALPNVLPVPPGTSVVLGTPLVFLAAQLALGRAPWLPSVIMQRSMLRADFASLVRRMAPWLVRGERLLRPRLMALTTPPIEYVVGLVCLVLALVLALPIPLGNVLPALAICLLALGVLERDGLWVLAGLLTTAISAAVVSGVIYAIVKAAIFFVTKVLQ
jgi:hypothetical protein